MELGHAWQLCSVGLWFQVGFVVEELAEIEVQGVVVFVILVLGEVMVLVQVLAQVS